MDGFGVALAKLLDEAVGQLQNVRAMLAQSQRVNREDFQMVIQVRGELARLHHCLQVPAGGSDHTHVALDGRWLPTRSNSRS